MNYQDIVRKAQHSTFYLWLLNRMINHMVPFNKPHGLKISKITESGVETILPYKKANWNHIKGLHAASLATISEFTTGLFILFKLDPTQYRLIMKNLSVNYLYQGKTSAKASFYMSHGDFNESIMLPVDNHGSVEINCEINTYDELNNQLTSGVVTWQIKSWKKVKTKL